MKAMRYCLLLSIFFFSLLIAGHQVAAQEYPHAVFGTVTSEGGSAAAGASVEVENLRTSETLTDTTDSLGRFQVDLTSMPGGYQDGDSIRVTAQLGDLSASRVVAVSGPNNECNLTLTSDGDGQIPALPAVEIGCVLFLLAPLAALIQRRRR